MANKTKEPTANQLAQAETLSRAMYDNILMALEDLIRDELNPSRYVLRDSWINMQAGISAERIRAAFLAEATTFNSE